jgi:hypothetical protein
MSFPRALSLCLLLLLPLLPALAAAETLSLPPADIALPDGLQNLDRNEAPDEATGKPGGIAVYTKQGDLPRSIFIFTYVPVATNGEPFDARDAAVKIGNPFDTSLKPTAAKPIEIDGAAGARYSGTLPNGLKVTSYAIEHGGYRLVVLLKGPPQQPYKALMEAVAKAVEGLQWKAAATATAPAATSAAAPAP